MRKKGEVVLIFSKHNRRHVLMFLNPEINTFLQTLSSLKDRIDWAITL